MYRLLAGFFAALVCAAASALAQSAPDAGYQPNLENGRYMYYAGGCPSCHAAPASDKCDDPASKDELKPVGGRCLKSEYGTFYVPNITPDKATGVGSWTTENFIAAITKGISPSGENLYPAFPYTSYQRMKRSDLLDLWAFLKTLEPVSAKTPTHDLSFPYSIRAGLRDWKGIYLDGKTFAPDPSKSDKINRGAYLVEGPGHCGECHTPRDALGGKIASKSLGGAPNPDGKGFVPNITPDKTGIGSWSEKDIVFALQTGFKPGGKVIGGVMAEVQRNTAKLTSEDREAIAAYLKSIPPVLSERPKKN
ncbi:MAG: cytochrome c [Rhodomicrobiaceae bacterium]